MSATEQAPPASTWLAPGYREKSKIPDAMLHLLEKMVELQQVQEALTKTSLEKGSEKDHNADEVASLLEEEEPKPVFSFEQRATKSFEDGTNASFEQRATKRVSQVTVSLESKESKSRSLSMVEELPDSIPLWVEIFLGSLGFLPSSSMSNRKRCLYFGFRTLLVAVHLMVFALSSFLTLLSFVLKGHAFAAEGMFAPLALTTLCLWFSIMRELGSGGVGFILLHDMTRRGYKWDAAERSAKRTQMTASVLFLVSILWLWRRLGASNLCQELEDDDLFGGGSGPVALCTAAMLTNGLLIPALLYMMLGILWTTRLLCKLHQHELMWYANALAEVLEEGQGYDNLMAQLSTHELSVTFRLRCASTTWVRSELVFLAFLCLNVLVIVTYLLSGHGKSVGDLTMASGACLFMAALFLAMGLPLAQVAEVFEYDVLHALNNPLVVKNAQQHFGQQLLSHLHTLGWGFRFGQTVINLRVFTNILGALLITIITSVSQAMLEHLG